MSGSVNKCILVGNLGNDPEVRNLPGGGKVVNLSIATSESWRDKNTGERKERTEWHRCVIFSEGLAKVAEQYLKKGSKVYLEGQLQTRRWTDQAGVEKFSTECVLQGFNSALVMLDGPSDRDQSSQSEAPRPRMSADKASRQIPQFDDAPKDTAYGNTAYGGFVEDDVPFIMEWRG